MYDANGKTLWSGSKIVLLRPYRTPSGKLLSVGALGIYHKQKDGAGYLSGIVYFGAEAVEVVSIDMEFFSGMKHTETDFEIKDMSKKACCPVCKTPLSYYGGADDYCNKCGRAVRYMRF